MFSPRRTLLALAVVLCAAVAPASASGDDSSQPPHINWLPGGGDHAEGDAGGHEQGPPYAFALFNFALFAGILYFAAGPALRKYFSNRHETIKNALEEAAKLQEQAKKKMAEYSERIADVDAEVKELIEGIKKESEEERARIVADAEAQAERMKKDAEARIEAEFAIAKRQLEAEVIAKAAEVAEAKLTSAATPQDHQNLFSSFITDLKTTSQSGDQA